MYQDISTPEQYNDLISKGAVAIDVRTPAEYNESKIPNINTGFDWNAGEFYDKVDELDASKDYVLVCRSGNRSVQAALFLESNGFTGNLYNLQGGMMGWSGATE